MTTQPKALACAAELEKTLDFQARAWDASKELRRLHAINIELTKALNAMLDSCYDLERDDQIIDAVAKARAAIAKSTL